MSLKKNILATYISQFYVTFIGIIILPLYIKYMGSEAYGLVGFFTLLQAWFSLLDLGLIPVLSRESARYAGGGMSALHYRNLVRALEAIFFGMALIGGCLLFYGSSYIATDWLQASTLSNDVVETSLQLMSLVIALRFFSGLYRSAINGAEKLVWLSGFNVFMASIRFIGVIPILLTFGATPIVFFSYQLGVAVLELAILFIYTRYLLPSLQAGEQTTLSLTPLKPILKLSLSIAFASLVWILITQIDKLILSKLLPLEEYAYFVLAVLVASAILTISSPISTAIMPRLSKLEAENDQENILRVYRNSTQLVTVFAGGLALTLALCAEPLLSLWTANPTLAKQAAPILTLYALGNGVLAVSAFPYYLQYAKGDLRLHLIGNLMFLLILVPFAIWMVKQYGSIGAGYAWLTTNLATFFLWLPFIHHKFQPGLNKTWYTHDILFITVTAALAGLFTTSVVPDFSNVWLQWLKILFTFGIVIFAGGMNSSFVRAQLHHWYKTLCHHRLFPSAS